MTVSIRISQVANYKDIVSAVDRGGHGYAVLIDDNDVLVGIVSDGDIRRCILNDTLTIDSMLNRAPKYCLSNEPYESVIAKMKAAHLKHMPIVDTEHRLINVVALDENDFLFRDNTVVIMAGGLGSRLGELTKETPKPMLKLANKPIIQHIIEDFRDKGFRNFIVSTRYKKEVIEDYFGDGRDFGVSISYVNEDKRLGTAGALSLIQEPLDKPFFVTNADVITKIDYQSLMDTHTESGGEATMCVRQYSQEIPFGVVECEADGEIKNIAEKPAYFFNINAGIYVLNPSAINLVPSDQFYDMPTLFMDLKKKGQKINSYRIEDYWIDIGNPEDYMLAQEDISTSEEASQ